MKRSHDILPSQTIQATMKAAQIELSESIIQEGRSRALLNSLYPTGVLQQMYADLKPEQIWEAQLQVQQEMEEQYLNSRYDDDDEDEDGQIDTEQPSQPRNSRGNESMSLEVIGETDVDCSQSNHHDDIEEQTPVSRVSPSAALRSSLEYGDSGDDDIPKAIPVPFSNFSVASPMATPGSTPNATPLRERHLPASGSDPSRLKLPRSKSSDNYLNSMNSSLSSVRRGKNPHKQNSGRSLELNASTTSLGDDSSEGNNNKNNNLSVNDCVNACIPAGEETIMCMRKNSLTLRRQSISRRVTMAHHRRVSVGYARRRSSIGTSSVNSSTGSSVAGRPIQERFAHTTVLFADIAGFTHWCSVREACHVFTLLESIYFVFDQIARDLGVYKIETIG